MQLNKFRKFVDLIENRAAACDGPVTPFLEELHASSDAEKERFTTILRELYALASPPAPEAMKLEISKEWFEKQAAKEVDLEIGAGRRTSTINLTPDEIGELEELALTALPQWAQDEIRSARAREAVKDDESLWRFWNDKAADMARKNSDLEAVVARLREALTPSGDTKAEYHGEFWINDEVYDEEEDEHRTIKKYIDWTTVKEIMAAILARADRKGEAP